MAAIGIQSLLSGFAHAEPLELEWVWSVFGERIGEAGFLVVDLNGDGKDEILATASDSYYSGPHRYWYVLQNRQGFYPIWSSLPSRTGFVDLTTFQYGSAVGIGAAETDRVQILEGWSRRTLQAFETESTDNRSLGVHDLDADGDLEAIVCDPDNLSTYDVETAALIDIKYGFGCTDLELGELDGDPEAEIVLAGNGFGGLVLDGPTLAVEWLDPNGFGQKIRLGDLDGDGLSEIVAGQLGWAGGLRAIHPSARSDLWSVSNLEVSDFVLEDMDPSPGLEVVVGTAQWGPVYILSGIDGTELASIANSDYGVDGLDAGDTDGDGTMEILWGGGGGSSGTNHLWLVEPGGSSPVLSSSSLTSPMVGIVAGDLLGTGEFEVAAASASSNHGSEAAAIVVLSLDRGRYRRGTPVPWVGGFWSWAGDLHGAQLDDDSAVEVCLGGYQVAGCFDVGDFSEQWMTSLPKIASSLEVAEIDGGGFPEVLVGTEDSYVIALEGENGWPKWQSPDGPDFQGGFDLLQALDLEADGQVEVVGSPSSSGIWSNWKGLAAFDSSDGALLAGPWEYAIASLATRPHPTQVGEQLVAGMANGSIVPLDPVTGVFGSPIASLPGGVVELAFFDFTGDEVAEIAAMVENRVYVLDGITGDIHWLSPYLGGWEDSALGMWVGDYDGDNSPDIVVGTGYGLARFEAPDSGCFADDFESGDTSEWSDTSDSTEIRN